MDKIKSLLNKQFKMKDLGVVNNFLGIHIVQKENEIELDQSTYLHKLLEKFDMKDCKPRYTPCEKNPFAFNNNSSETEQSDQSSRKFREIVGSLVYAMVCTRPDLSWIVTKLSQH